MHVLFLAINSIVTFNKKIESKEKPHLDWNLKMVRVHVVFWTLEKVRGTDFSAVWKGENWIRALVGHKQFRSFHWEQILQYCSSVYIFCEKSCLFTYAKMLF